MGYNIDLISLGTFFSQLNSHKPEVESNCNLYIRWFMIIFYISPTWNDSATRNYPIRLKTTISKPYQLFFTKIQSAESLYLCNYYKIIDYN